MSEIIVGISGMTCGACSASITEALIQKKGVQSVDISLITEEGRITYDDKFIQSGEIVQTIEDCGFDATVLRSNVSGNPKDEVETIVSIQGMTCGSCSASITKALEELSGVTSVSISLLTENGKVIHDSSISNADIIQSIEDCGFDAQVLSTNNASSYIIESRFQIIGMTCGACSASVTKTLEELEGVVEVSVSLITEEAMIKHTNEISVDSLKTAIEECGFDANFLSSIKTETQINEVEEVTFRVFGLQGSESISNFEYNLEAVITHLGYGILDYNLNIENESTRNTSNIPNSEDPDSEIINEEVGGQDLVNELTIHYDSSKIGIRDILKDLNSINADINFLILNSQYESSELQLKLLSKVKEINYWRSNFFRCFVVGVPIFILSRTQNVKFFKETTIFEGLFLTTLIQGVLSSYVQFKSGKTFQNKFFTFIKMKGGNATMDILVFISSIISFSFSVLSVMIGIWNGVGAPPKTLFETNAMIITYISLGKWIENKAKGATSTALSQLLSLSPNECTIVTDMGLYEQFINTVTAEKTEKGFEQLNDETFPTTVIGIELIQKNDITIILPGSNIPGDGEVIFGESEIDESLITGESLPVYKKVGDGVYGGSINGPGLLHVKITKSGKNSQLQKVIKLVKDSQINKAPIQRYSDYIAARFVPIILLLSLVTFLFWLFFCYLSDSLPKVFKMEENGRYFVCLKLSISVIVVACPCALGLASPTAIMVGTGLGAKYGTLIKGGEILEKASNIDILLFDKTGTLTTGKMNLLRYEIAGTTKQNTDHWWQLIGAIESNSEHPIGQALVKVSRSQLGLFEEDKFVPVTKSFNSVTGMGVKGEVIFNGTTFEMIIGNKKLIDSNNLVVEDIESSNTIIYVVINQEYQGYIELTDELKPKARTIIDHLKYEKNYIVGMVTGDNTKVAERIGKSLGINNANIFSEVSPIHKDKIVEELRSKFKNQAKIAFIGDGINDAPALSNADVGIAIANGTDIAIESSDIVLMNENNDLYGVPMAFEISQKTFRRIKINFIWAMIYNLVMVPFAMGCFLPFNVMLPPIAASLAMAFSSVSVVASSLLLNRWKPDLKNYSVAKDFDIEDFEDFDLKNDDYEAFIRHKAQKNRKTNVWKRGYRLIN